MVTVTLNPAIDHTVTIPGFHANTVNRVANGFRTAGGKGINVGSFLADFGIPIVVTGFLGRSNLGLFTDHFAAKGIEDRFVRVEGETRVNLKILNPTENEVTDINHPGAAPTAGDLVQLESVLDGLAANHVWFVLSGSLPPGIPDTAYSSLVSRLRSRGREVLLDTSGEALRHALSASPTVIKPNVRELEDALGRGIPTETSLLEAARELVGNGIPCVIVSRGADGAIFVAAGHALSARYRAPVNIRTTVGAGDALVAGYLAARVERLDPESRARLAIAFSIAALQRTGSAPLPARAILAKLAESVEIRSLA
jgi:1-phosphofructokinase family hexose kinase